MAGQPNPVDPPNTESVARVFDRITEAVFALDEEFRFTYLNEQAEELLETDAEVLLGERMWDEFPDVRETELFDAIETALDSQESVRTELYYDPLDFWVDARVYPSETGLSVYLRDVTEQKEHERELAFRRALLEAQAETTIDGQLVVDQDRNIVHHNERFAELWDIPEEVLSERSDERAIEFVLDALADPGEFLAKVEYLYEHPHEESRDEIQLADGRWLDRYSAPVIGEDGTHYGRLWLFRDITEQKEREQFLEDAKARLEAATEAGAVGTWEWHVQEDEFVTGPSFARLFGVNPEAAREGVSLDRFVSSIHEDDRDRVLDAIEEALESCGEYQEEYRVRNEAGELRWVVARGHVKCDEDGTPITFPGAVTDITERKEYRHRLEESNERLQQFAYAVSHDLQEPLRMVSRYLQLVEQRYGDELDEDGREFIDFAVDGADRMREMIDGLLEYSRIETQGNDFEPTDLEAVLDDVITDLQVRIDESDAEITREPLPTVTGDEEQLREVFLNLLDNAIEYSGDEPPRIHVSAERCEVRSAAENDGDEWVIAVEDEGIGIDPDNQERIFQVFDRLHAFDEHEGTGLGLALCERIVERHGGEIWVESEPGEGATFFFTLPPAEDDGGSQP